MQFNQLTLMARLCIGHRFQAQWLVLASIVAFILSWLWYRHGQHPLDAIPFQTITLVYLWGIYLTSWLPVLRGLRSNKSFQLIQQQKQVCYGLVVAGSGLVALFTLMYFMQFGSMVLTNTIFIIITVVMAMRARAASSQGEIYYVCQPIFAMAMIFNLFCWAVHFWSVYQTWMWAAAAIMFSSYAWVLVINCRIWVRRIGSYKPMEYVGLVSAPYQRRYF